MYTTRNVATHTVFPFSNSLFRITAAVWHIMAWVSIMPKECCPNLASHPTFFKKTDNERTGIKTNKMPINGIG